MPFVGSTAVAKLRRSGGPERPKMVTGMQRRAPNQRYKSRASRPRPSGSNCLTSEVVSRELGANYTQNRKEHQQERGRFGRPGMALRVPTELAATGLARSVLSAATPLKSAELIPTAPKGRWTSASRPKQVRSTDPADCPRRRWRRSSPGRAVPPCRRSRARSE